MDEVLASLQNHDVQEQHAVISWQYKNLPCAFHILLQQTCEQTILAYKHENYFYSRNTLMKNVKTENWHNYYQTVLIKSDKKNSYLI